MKYLIYFGFFISVLFASCDKAIEDAKEDAIIKIMVNGQWSVTKYIKGDSTVTPDFAGYTFQFYENRTVHAIKNTTVEKSGTWEGDGTALTIYSNFINANYPLTLLNGTFQLTNSGQTFVEAKITVNGELRLLRLDK